MNQNMLVLCHIYYFLQEVTDSNILVFPAGTIADQIQIVLLEKNDVSQGYQLQIDLRACFETGKNIYYYYYYFYYYYLK